MLEKIVKFFRLKYKEKKPKESYFLTTFLKDLFKAKRCYIIRENIPTSDKPHRDIFTHHVFHKDDTIIELNLVFKDLNIALARRYDCVGIDIQFIANDFIDLIRIVMEQYHKEYNTEYPEAVKQRYIESLESEINVLAQTVKLWRAQKKLDDFKEIASQHDKFLRESIAINLDE